MSVEALQDFTFTSKYARYNPKKRRRSTFAETQDVARDMHIGRFPHVADEITWAFQMAKERRVLGSQRILQFVGEPVLRVNARAFNCLAVETQFVTKAGVRSFSDFKDGDNVQVLSHTGAWRHATVRSYGMQRLNRVTITRGTAQHEVRTTGNHRWLLADGTETNDLAVGDCLLKAPNVFGGFAYDSASPMEKLYWAYGYVFGDGTVTTKDGVPSYSMVRICKKDRGFLERFQELGFKDSTCAFLDGDVIAFTGRYLKTAPDPKVDDPSLIRAFVRGYLDADGARNSNYRLAKSTSPNPFLSIQATGLKHIQFIRECFPVAGMYIVSETDLTGQETNYGVRPETVHFRVINGFGRCAAHFRVTSIVPDAEELVWCLEVEEDRSFVLPFGVVTGNCCSSYVDRIRFFQEALWLLLCGCGTGFSVQHHHIAKLPDFHERLTNGHYLSPEDRPEKTHYVEDSIEGWANALGILLATYFPHAEFAAEWDGNQEVVFDFSFVRPKGSLLSSGAGKAPGPEPLKRSLEAIRTLLERCVSNGQTRLRSIDAYDIVMHASDAVLAGGVRRSASICLFSPDDELMAKAKTGNWFIDNPQRGRSNNSAVLVRNQTSREQFAKLMVSVKEFGEPGFLWSDSTEVTFNPCVEIAKYPVDLQTGLTGWAFCNLCEINGKKCKTEEDFRKAARAGAIIGTLQASFTKFAYLGEVSERIAEQEALLGVSITGIMDSPDVLFDPEIQRRTAQLVVEVNKEFAAKIGIKQAARTTCVKPAGTTSLVLGTASGIHAHHSRRYIRRIQANELDAPAQFYGQHNPRAVEKSVWSQNGTDIVIGFPVEVGARARTRKEVDAITLLKHVKLTQNNWVEAGTVPERCAQPFLRHNVSNTITVRDNEWAAVEEYIYENRESFAGLSLLSASGDLDYPQAPFSSVKTAEELIADYGDGALMASGLIVDGKHAFNDNLWTACDHFVAGQVPFLLLKGVREDLAAYNAIQGDLWAPQTAQAREFAQQRGLEPAIASGANNHLEISEERLDWLRRAQQFANRYFEGDTRKMTYCLKESSNFKLYLDLVRENVPVDFSQLIEGQDDTKLQEAVACAGGTCEI